MNLALERRLFQACHLLFGPEVEISQDFLHYLQPSGLKSAYRRRALLCHPDRLTKLTDRDRQRGAKLFIEANEAYEILSRFVRSRHADDRQKPIRQHSATARAYQEHFHRGDMPLRCLLIGQYMVYRGLISWEQLVRALSWQRRGRPRAGEIARRWRLLDAGQLSLVLAQRRSGERIGETAARLGLLTRHQVAVILHHQRRQQRPLGRYFVGARLLGEEELAVLLAELARHNARAVQCRGQGTH